MAILSKAYKRDIFKLHNPLKLSFTNIRHLCSNFVDCLSFLEPNSPDILSLCETNLDCSINYGNLFVRGYLPLIWQDSNTHMHYAYFHTLYEGGTSFCTGTISPKPQQIPIYVFDWLYFTQCLASFSSINHLLRLCSCFRLWFYLI